MAYGFLDIAATPSVKAAQHANGSGEYWATLRAIARSIASPTPKRSSSPTRDSFYMATVSETGWPYVQHRGGPPGFLHVLDDRTLGLRRLPRQPAVHQRSAISPPTIARH